MNDGSQDEVKSTENAEMTESLPFAEAMDELETLLRRIEDEEVDIDVLGDELRRAAGLLEVCRQKIRRAEVEVTQIVQSLAQDQPSASADAGEDS